MENLEPWNRLELAQPSKSNEIRPSLNGVDEKALINHSFPLTEKFKTDLTLLTMALALVVGVLYRASRQFMKSKSMHPSLPNLHLILIYREW